MKMLTAVPPAFLSSLPGTMFGKLAQPFFELAHTCSAKFCHIPIAMQFDGNIKIQWSKLSATGYCQFQVR